MEENKLTIVEFGAFGSADRGISTPTPLQAVVSKTTVSCVPPYPQIFAEAAGIQPARQR